MDYSIYMPVSKTRALNGVIIYYHHSTFGVQEVPTADPGIINTIASLYLTSAYAIVFINYLGYNSGDLFPHPFVQYPTCNTKSSIIALNSVLPKLKRQYPAINKFKLFAAGYSEGAAYALQLEKCLAQPQDCENVKLDVAYEYKAAAVMSGPYDLVKTIKNFLTNEVQRLPEKSNIYQIEDQETTNFHKAPLAAMTIMSYMYYSQGMDDY